MYAHTRIHDWRTDRTYEPGEAVPDDLPGLEELVEYSESVELGYKTVSDEPYEEPATPTPPVVTLGDSLYVRADEITRKIAEASAKLRRGDIGQDEFDEIVAGISDLRAINGSDSGGGQEVAS